MSYKRTGTTHNSRKQHSLAVSESRRPHSASRHPLNPVYPNIRRAKSRNALLADEDPEDRFPTGSKRKRVASGPENAHAHCATLQARPSKRLKRVDNSQSDDDDSHSDTEHDVYDTAEDLNSEEYLDKAPEWKLLKLRKDQLLHLYERATGGHGKKDADNLGKQDLAKAIMHARSKARNKFCHAKNAVFNKFSRRRVVTHPQAPHTPDSDDVDRGHTIAQRFGLERNTAQESKAPGTLGRSFSLSTLALNTRKLPKRHGVASSQSTFSIVSSSSAGDIPPTPLTPPRTRGRKLSERREKHVEFVESADEAVEQDHQSTSEGEDDESDDGSVDLASRLAEPSPRRLRSRSTAPSTSSIGSTSTNSSIRPPRKLPPRQAKHKARSFNEDDTELDDKDSGGEELPASSELGDDDDTPSGLDEDSTPEPKPVRQRKDSKASRSRLQTPPPEDDDMESQHESDEGTVDGYQPTPRKLRNGKVLRKGEATPPSVLERGDDSSELSDLSETDTSVTEESSDSEVDDKNDEDYVEEDSAITMVTIATAGVDDEGSTIDTDDDVDAEGEDEEINLGEHTATTLARYRKEQLVRLCKSKGVDAEGTKSQLVKALLQWRSRRRSVSSGGSTVRAPSTAVPRPVVRRRKQQVPHDGKPVLERSDRVHVSQPRTPPVSGQSESVVIIHAKHRGEEEEGLELDLESLGLEDKEIPPEKLIKLEKIGSGGFKDVYTGKFRNRKVAIAEFRGQLTAMDIKELKLLRDFDHPNVVRFLGVSIPQDTKTSPVMMVSELCSNGDLFDYVRNVPAPSYPKVLKVMHDIASGLMYLHTHKPSIIHRDCKSSNILITTKGSAKIADFGLAKVKQSTRSMVRSLVGTVNWQAPELWHAHPKYDHKVDVFSCGMVFWEILTWYWREKKYPWEGMNEHAIYEAVGTKRQRPSVSGLRKQWSPEIVELMERMWAQDPHDRPTMTQVVEELDTMMS